MDRSRAAVQRQGPDRLGADGQSAPNHWVAKDGELLNETKGANLRTTRKFDDFKLHIEYNCPENGNSGIYLRGRYEVQIEYEPEGTEDKFHTLGRDLQLCRADGDAAAQTGPVGDAWTLRWSDGG